MRNTPKNQPTQDLLDALGCQEPANSAKYPVFTDFDAINDGPAPHLDSIEPCVNDTIEPRRERGEVYLPGVF